MKTIEQQIKEYEEKLNYIYAKANTKSKMKRIEDSLFMFSDMCHDRLYFDEPFHWEKDGRLVDHSAEKSSMFRANILAHKDLYEQISESVINAYISENISFYELGTIEYKRFHKLKKGQMIEIISSFLSEFNSDLYRTFKEKLKDETIFIDKDGEEGSLGVTYGIAPLKKNLMFATSGDEIGATIRVAATLMHEFGHDYEMNLYHKSGIQNRMWLYPFFEVSSQFFEYAFIKYLIDNRIYTEDTKLYTQITLYELFYFMFGINLFSEIKKESDNEYTLDLDRMKEKELQICERINYYGMHDFDMNMFKKSYIYGLGYLFSPYLYENYKNNPNFMKEFQNALLTYPYTNSIYSFEKVGVTPEILIEGKTLKKVLGSSR